MKERNNYFIGRTTNVNQQIVYPIQMHTPKIKKRNIKHYKNEIETSLDNN